MGRKIALLYIVFSILALLVLSVWTTSSLLETKARNLAAATQRFSALTRDVAAIYSGSGGVENPTFRSFVRSLFLSDPTLEVVLIESPESGLQYLFARHAGYVQNPESIGRSWHGSIVYNATLERLFSAPLRLESHPHAELQAVYAIFNRESLYPTLRPLLTALLGFVILTGIVIALLSILRAGRLPTAAAGEPPEGTLGQFEADEPVPRSADAAREPPPPRSPDAAPLVREQLAAQAPPVRREPPPHAHQAAVVGSPEGSPQRDSIPEEGDSRLAEIKPWSVLSEQVVPLEPESGPPTAPGPSARRDDSPAAATGAGELPPGVILPTLAEITAESEPAPDTDALSGKSAAAGLKAPPAAESPLPTASEERHPSAEDELADIEDFEDLETIDGSPSPDGDEPRRRPSVPPRRPEPPLRTSEPAAPPVPPRRPVVVPTFVDLHEEDEEIAELEEIQEEMEGPAIDAVPPAENPAGARPLGGNGGGGLLKRLLAQDAASGGAPDTLKAGAASPRDSEASPRTDRGGPHGLFAPETGLGWSEYFEKRLSFEIDRCASFDQDLSIALMRCRTPIGSQARKELARQILLNFTFQDLCFEYGADGFAVILPNLEIDGAQRKLETFQGRIAEEEENLPPLCVGLAARNGRLLPGARLRAEAESALAKAVASPTETIAAVRVDPGVYRRRA